MVNGLNWGMKGGRCAKYGVMLPGVLCMLVQISGHLLRIRKRKIGEKRGTGIFAEKSG